MRALLLLIGLYGCSPAVSQSGSVSDLRAVVRFLEDVHPDPYAHVEPATFRAVVEREAAWLEARDDEHSLALSLHRVLATLRDGHLALAIPALQPDRDAWFLPVWPKRAGSTTFVDASESELPPGTVLLAIDDEPIETLYAELSDLVMADGVHESARRADLEAAFPRYHRIARGPRERYEVRVRLPDGEEREVEVSSIGRDALLALAERRRSARVQGPLPDGDGPRWPFVVRIDDETVMLRLSSFGVPDEAEYARRVDALFESIDETDTLVLDLRGNQGGLRTHGVAVLNHVLGRPYAQWERLSARVRRIPRSHRARVSFPVVPEEALEQLFAGPQDDAGLFVVDGDPLADRMRPHGDGHLGPVVVFVDGVTNSAAVEMVVALRAHAPVTVVGVETGGECGRHVGELPVVYTTESYSIGVLVSLIELTHVPTPGCASGRGIRPDREVSYDEDHFLAGRDPYIEVLAEL